MAVRINHCWLTSSQPAMKPARLARLPAQRLSPGLAPAPDHCRRRFPSPWGGARPHQIDLRLDGRQAQNRLHQLGFDASGDHPFVGIRSHMSPLSPLAAPFGQPWSLDGDLGGDALRYIQIYFRLHPKSGKITIVQAIDVNHGTSTRGILQREFFA